MSEIFFSLESGRHATLYRFTIEKAKHLSFISRKVSSLFKCHTTFSYILIKWKVSRGDRQASKGFSLLSEPKIPEQKAEAFTKKYLYGGLDPGAVYLNRICQ